MSINCEAASLKLAEKVTSILEAKQDQYVRELNTFPYFLFGSTQENLMEQKTIRVKHFFSMHRRHFVEHLRPLLKFCGFDEFKEIIYDGGVGNNCLIKKVENMVGIGKDFLYSIKYSTLDHDHNEPSEEPTLNLYPEIKLDRKEKEKWNLDEHELFGMLEILCCFVPTSYQLKVHRTRFQFKDNPHVMLNLDRVSFSEGKGYVVYSIYGDVPSSVFENISENERKIEKKQQLSFVDYMKPCRSKSVQYVYEFKSRIYPMLLTHKIIPNLDYETISLLEYEAQRLRYKWEEFNKKVEKKDQKSEEYIDIMEKAALVGKAHITYEHEEGEERPYYSDDEDDDQ